MSFLAWMGIALFVLILMIAYLLSYKVWGRPKNYRTPASRIVPKAYTSFEVLPPQYGERLRRQRQMPPLAKNFDGTPVEQRVPDQGPSAELLMKMEAAGMNTTHERWEDFEAANKTRRRQRTMVDDDHTDDYLFGAALSPTLNSEDHHRDSPTSPIDAAPTDPEGDSND